MIITQHTRVYLGKEGKHGEEKPRVGECGIGLEEREDTHKQECCVKHIVPKIVRQGKKDAHSRTHTH